LGFFAESDGESSFDSLRQLNMRTTNDNLLGGGNQDPLGVYEFDINGNVVGIVAAAGRGAWGAFELGNGEIIYTNSSASGNIRSDSQIYFSGGAFRFISVTSVPEPSSCLLITASLAAMTLIRKRP
ncbi:MAG: PEP-CTERM sorting domain-containing protein, partial [Myxococcota bacterium]